METPAQGVEKKRKESSKDEEKLLRVAQDSGSRVEKKLTDADIPRLRAQWYESNKDIMSGVPEKLPPFREVNHHIKLVDDNKKYHYYLPRCPDSLKAELMAKIDRYTRAGWWEPKQVEQAAPMLCIPKKNGTLRTAIDCRRRNDNTVKDVTPFPDQDQIRLDVARAKYRSKIDLSDAYEQVRLAPEDVAKTAFATIFGTYVSHVMQIGDCNAPSTFQRLMTWIFRMCIAIFLHIYLDDLFIYSNTLEEHERHLQIVFATLRKHGLYIQAHKCELYAEVIDCLGHKIDNRGLHADADKMARIRLWRTPRNYNDVQKFVGLIQYLAHFLPDVTSYTGPLMSITASGNAFVWRPIHERCFEMIKRICCKTLVLKPVDHRVTEPIWVICDASIYGVGAMYGQGPTWQTCRPAGFMSRKFTDAQRNYRIFELEMIAILEALLKWEDKLLGYRVHIVTDHQSLEFFKTQNRLSARQARWMEYLSRFDYTIQYIKGITNKAADALSRYHESDTWYDEHAASDFVDADVRLDKELDTIPWDRLQEVKHKPVHMKALKTRKQARAEMQEIPAERPLEWIEERDVAAAAMEAAREADPPLEAANVREEDPTIFQSRARGENLVERLCSTSQFAQAIKDGYDSDPLFKKVLEDPGAHKAFTVREDFIWMKNPGNEDVVCVPYGKTADKSLIGRIIDQAHTTVGHFGAQRTADYVRRWYWWPGLSRAVRKFCATCEICMRAKDSNQRPAGVLHSLPLPTRPWQSIGMDFIGPFPLVDGFNYLWVVICRMTMMVHLIPVNTKTTATELSWIYLREVVRLHGLAESIVSDRDSKFTSRWWRELHRILGAKLLMSTSFHPATDGVTERANRSIGQIFRATIRPDQKDWVQRVPMTEFAINASISESTGFAPFELNGGFMPAMMAKADTGQAVSPGVRAFAETALRNLADAHDALIASRVFQRHYANKRRQEEPKIAEGDLVYLSTKNLNLPKGRAKKLLPRFIGPYKVTRAIPESSNYELELPEELVRRRVHSRFHVNLLRPHNANDDALFPNRMKAEPYDFGTPEDGEWYVDEIKGHRWHGKNLEFEVRWSQGDTTWEPLESVDEVEALDRYLALIGVREPRDLPRKVAR